MFVVWKQINDKNGLIVQFYIRNLHFNLKITPEKHKVLWLFPLSSSDFGFGQ